MPVLGSGNGLITYWIRSMIIYKIDLCYNNEVQLKCYSLEGVIEGTHYNIDFNFVVFFIENCILNDMKKKFVKSKDKLSIFIVNTLKRQTH